MIGFILLTVLKVALIAGLWISIKKDNDASIELFALPLAFVLTGFIVSVVIIASIPSDSKYLCNRKARCENLVQSINDKMSTETISYIISDAISINKKIENHRAHVDSKFSGIYYSKKIAEQEFIELPELTITITNKNNE